MTRPTEAVVILLISVSLCCDSVLSWGHHFGGGSYHYNQDYHHHNQDYHRNNHHNNRGGGQDNFNRRTGTLNYPENNERHFESAVIESVVDEGDTVGRFRRQNGTGFGQGQANNNNNNNVNSCRVANNRVLGQWRCDSGEIIDCNGLCNGRRSCADGSDETVLSCRNVFCLDSAFRCAYGGCIRSEMECNGVVDCADGSDERTLNCPGVLNKIRTNGNCSEGFFQCKSGDCIYDDGVCSGGAECPDGSDETAEVCSTHFCPEPGFRCDYGACILRSSRCNGKQDCVDGSDERPELCGSLTGTTTPNRPIESVGPGAGGLALMTDSLASMTDPLPSMTDSLAAIPTVGPSSTPTDFRWIVSMYRELLFKLEDQIVALRQENLQLRLNLLDVRRDFPNDVNINRPAIRPAIRPETELLDPIITRPNLTATTSPIRRPPVADPTPSPTAPIRRPETIPPISSGPREEGDCDAPVLQGGRVSDVFSRRYDNRVVKNGEEIIFECLAGTSLIGANSTFCINGKLLQSELPICTSMCSGLPLNTLSVQAECFEPTGVKIPCSPLLPPKTIAILTCKVGYKRPERVVPDAYNCMDDGNWNAHVYKCIPICGEVTEGRRLIVGGQDSNITQVPWHAGIYENSGSNGRMQQICGGSIINPTAIVTAAHCFWDQQTRQMKAAELYGVAVGKTLRDFDAEEPTAQKYKVSSIKIYDQYMDYEGLYVSDIAVVLLDKPIIFQSYIKPICVDYSLKGNQRYVVSGIQGRVAGWGLTASQGEPSTVLKTLDLPTVDFNTCLNESPPSFKPFITTDKFCGGFTSGESVCKGDSGGGLAFPRASEDKLTTVYFLRGIVSVGPILQGSCDNTKYSAFTDIQLHNMFLYDYLFV